MLSESLSAALTCMTRLAQRNAGERRWLEEALGERLEILAEPALDVAVETGGSDRARPGLLDRSRREEAVEALQEALRLVRPLAGGKPWRPRLASILNNLGALFFDLGRWDEALAPAQEAAELRRELANLRPDAFLPDLASSLTNPCNVLNTLGCLDQVSYLKAAVGAGVEVDPELLAPIAESLASDPEVLP